MQEKMTKDPVFWVFCGVTLSLVCLILVLASSWTSNGFALAAIWLLALVLADFAHKCVSKQRGWTDDSPPTWRPVPNRVFLVAKLICVLGSIVLLLWSALL